MDVSFASCVRSPRECAMSERNLKLIAPEESWPQLRHLLTLRDRVRGHEANPDCCAFDVSSRLEKPRRDISSREPDAPRRRIKPAAWSCW